MNRSVLSVALVAALALLALVHGQSIAATGDCGQPQSTGAGPKTADALATLKTAVGSPSSCDAKPCVCDVNADAAVNTTDALRVLRVAVGQSLTLTCDCGPAECVTLGGAATLASGDAATSGLTTAPRQIQIAVEIVGIDKLSYDELGFDFSLVANVLTDLGPAAGGTNGHATNLAVDSNASGGPAGSQYFLYGEHHAGSCLPVLNKNFVSPFDAVKTFFLLPTDGCVLFDETALSTPQNFPGGDPVQNLASVDAGFGGSMVHHDFFSESEAAALLASIGADNRNTVLSAPLVTAYSGQTIIHMVDDVEPSLNQIVSDFRTRIQDVTMNPFGNFTGASVDFVPRIEIEGHVTLDIRIATEIASFYYSTAFMVDGFQVDAEIPLHRRSRNIFSINVPTGKTLVLGGMMRTGQPSADKGLPVLSNLPLIGSLFTHKQLDAATQNLMVFITPTILNEDE